MRRDFDRDLQLLDMSEHIRQSNLIENIDDPREDRQSMVAWQFLRDQRRISQPTLLDLHSLITKNQLAPAESGRYRQVMVTVGPHVPPEPFLAQQLIYNWLYAMLDHWKTLDPIEMHIRFEKIHPFVDGNGRTGRMLLWWHQIKQGEEPTLFTFAEREKYYELFRD